MTTLNLRHNESKAWSRPRVVVVMHITSLSGIVSTHMGRTFPGDYSFGFSSNSFDVPSVVQLLELAGSKHAEGTTLTAQRSKGPCW